MSATRGASRPASGTAQEPVDRAARVEFAERYGSPDLGPVCVVIAAYREEASIGQVIREIPGSVLRRRVAVLVVDDGSDDGTAVVARTAGAFVAVVPRNRGQGAALRLAYALAIEHGARYLVSLDADGQYDPTEISGLLEPVLEGAADFVSGSRRLGSTYDGDRFRRAGVRVYGTAIRVLTGQHVTDPSFGLRAMRAEVPLTVPLHEPQFQAAELLVGAIMHGYRLEERPATMRRRTAGASRKGGNIRYGYQFGQVLLSTWWHGRRTQRAT